MSTASRGVAGAPASAVAHTHAVQARDRRRTLNVVTVAEGSVSDWRRLILGRRRGQYPDSGGCPLDGNPVQGSQKRRERIQVVGIEPTTQPQGPKGGIVDFDPHVA